MAIAEFEAVIGTTKRITIPSRINVKQGERVLVKIYHLEDTEEIPSTKAVTPVSG